MVPNFTVALKLLGFMSAAMILLAPMTFAPRIWIGPVLFKIWREDRMKGQAQVGHKLTKVILTTAPSVATDESVAT